MPSPIDELVKAFEPLMHNIVLLLVAVTIIVVVSIVALAYTATTRTGVEASQERIFESLVSEEEAPRTRRRRGGIGGLGERDVSLLKMLESRESLPVDTLKEESEESPRVLSERLSKLRDEGLVEVSGGVVTLTRRGKRLVELMREKYWYRELEKKRKH